MAYKQPLTIHDSRFTNHSITQSLNRQGALHRFSLILHPSSFILHPSSFVWPGAARQLVTFSCAAKEKVTKEKAAQVRRS
jgi:hypothetical protein